MSAVLEASNYHDSSQFGFFSILQSNQSGRFQRTYLIKRLEDVISSLNPNLDSWISQAEFKKPNRQTINFLRVRVAFCDIDYYSSPAFAGSPPEKLAEQLIWFCQYNGFPVPSVIVYSGRGLQIKWLFNSYVPDFALIRWQALQKCICDTFSHFGSDPKSRDASRVLRVVGTINTKSNETCRIIYENIVGNGELQKYSFDALFDSFMPFTRDEMRAITAEQNSIRKEKSKSQKNRKKNDHSKTLTAKNLNWCRFLDLKHLCQLRGWNDGVPAGMQDWFLFLSACFLSWSINPERLDSEILSLAMEYCPDWKLSEAIGVTKTAISKAKSAAAGEKVQYLGKPCDPRYMFKNITLIETLSISDSEQRELRTIIGHDERLRRARNAAEIVRRKSGKMKRANYLSATNEKRMECMHKKQNGQSVTEIAAEMGVDRTTVWRWLESTKDMLQVSNVE